MVNIGVMIVLFVLGAMMGSFACCQAWRLRQGDKAKWSHCMHCKYRLQWYDNIPIASWLALRGKCRKCGKKIGCAEILTEIGTALVFALSYALWPWFEALSALDGLEMAKFGLFLAILTIFAVLCVYDIKWRELPVKLLYGAWGVGILFLALNSWQSFQMTGAVDWQNLVGAVLIMPVFYYLLYRLSSEKLVGGGDWMLCVPLALMLGNFWLAMFAMFAANLLGSLVMLPVAILKRSKHMQIPFGPFLVAGFLVVFFCQGWLLKFIGAGL